jgi:hypothetical protein
MLCHLSETYGISDEPSTSIFRVEEQAALLCTWWLKVPLKHFCISTRLPRTPAKCNRAVNDLAEIHWSIGK